MVKPGLSTSSSGKMVSTEASVSIIGMTSVSGSGSASLTTGSVLSDAFPFFGFSVDVFSASVVSTEGSSTFELFFFLVRESRSILPTTVNSFALGAKGSSATGSAAFSLTFSGLTTTGSSGGATTSGSLTGGCTEIPSIFGICTSG